MNTHPDPEVVQSALRTLITHLDGCDRFERGAGGMTIDAQIRRTELRGVKAIWVEEAREALETRLTTPADPVAPAWRSIDTVPNQETVLVCNAAYLGWWCIAIQNALGEWWKDGTQSPPKYEPTHWQPLPSIQSLRSNQAGHA